MRFLKMIWNIRTGIVGLIVAAIIGAAGMVSFNAAVEWTNTEKFCLSCHEMRDFVYQEYKDTIHYNNRSGVRAVCSDCHVPKETIPKLIRKVRATFEVWHKLTGKIDTREKFEEHRADLAMRVWTTMKKNDSLECRNCHDYKHFSQKKQTEKAWTRHEKAQKEGKTCIDCHFAIAHNEPEGDKGPQDIIIKK